MRKAMYAKRKLWRFWGHVAGYIFEVACLVRKIRVCPNPSKCQENRPQRETRRWGATFGSKNYGRFRGPVPGYILMWLASRERSGLENNRRGDAAWSNGEARMRRAALPRRKFWA